ncbi:class I SAM-dependent methyltransferase [candidate division WOR-3 bacterium]|nr:class I SAM-dependent methyltransferase [candidate division WOR-3 bacterium]
MDVEKATGILCCPKCKNEIKIINKQELQCGGCGEKFEYQDNLIDFNVREQEHFNNWSGSTEAERTEKWFDQLISENYLTREDCENIGCNLNVDQLMKAIGTGLSMIRNGYYNPYNKTIIDVCCGTGSLFNDEMDYSKLSDKTIILTDLSRTAQTKNQERLNKIATDCDFVYCVCDVRNLPVKDDSADLISTFAGFGNAENGKSVLYEVKRVLKRTGKFTAVELLYGENSRTVRLSEKMGTADLATVDRITRHFAEADFTDIKTNTIFRGLARMAGDFFPLKGEESTVTIMSAIMK